jgi:hypothetical protein
VREQTLTADWLCSLKKRIARRSSAHGGRRSESPSAVRGPPAEDTLSQDLVQTHAYGLRRVHIVGPPLDDHLHINDSHTGERSVRVHGIIEFAYTSGIGNASSRCYCIDCGHCHILPDSTVCTLCILALTCCTRLHVRTQTTKTRWRWIVRATGGGGKHLRQQHLASGGRGVLRHDPEG